MKKLSKKAFILPLIIVIAATLVVYKINTKPPIDHVELQFPTKTVEVITAKLLPFRTRAVAYGHIEPATTLKAKTEINGKISYIHPDLEQGASLAKGTVVLRIEPTAFEFSLDQSKAGLASSQHSLKQLEVEEKTTQQFLIIAQKNFDLGQIEVESAEKLLKQKVISPAKYNITAQKQLQLQQQVEDLEGKLASFPSRKAMTEAQISKSKIQLEQSQDILKRTEIILPFDARIGSVFVEKDEYVGVSAILFEALGTEAVEVTAQLPIQQFSALLSGNYAEELNLHSPAQIQTALTQIDLDANVQLVQNEGQNAQWRGKIMRITEAINPTTNTLGLVVRIDDPYGLVVPGEQPPLIKGMFVQIEFVAAAQDMLVLPRRAIHQGRVYVANEANILEILTVNVIHKQGELMVVEADDLEGKKVIITDVIPVIEGQPLQVIEAVDYEKNMKHMAIGETTFGMAQ